ncbi:MAG: Ppx/GppA phosphatase family protein [Hyphomicrobium sp.]
MCGAEDKPDTPDTIRDLSERSPRDGTLDFKFPPYNRRGPVYAALDLGTNNCRLLLARPTRRGFRVVDAFSRIIRLGEGVSQTGLLSEAAMIRTIDALKICASKIERAGECRSRLVATEACRSASNGSHFLERVREELGLHIEILTPEEEATLAVIGCATLIDMNVDYALVFDIGGGSSELIWLDLRHISDLGPMGAKKLIEDIRKGTGSAIWASLPIGVVSITERFGGQEVTPELFERMVSHVAELIAPFETRHNFRKRIEGKSIHFLGTSGTVTTVAGIKLGLQRYDRNKVDGCWMGVSDVKRVTYDLLDRTYAERVAEPCIGRDRADLVLGGCAILEAILREWPGERLRVADRGLREGILSSLMIQEKNARSSRNRYGANKK